MARIRQTYGNSALIPQGMLAPNGYVDTPTDPFVQATTRPAGTLLASSPGFDSIRPGKNIFQGKGPTGGFSPMEFAEDVGGSGAALSVIPGQTSEIEATEYLSGPGVAPVGTFIIADRSLNAGYAKMQHEGYNTFPDMGDRTPERPLSRSAASWVWHPAMMFRDEYRQNPATAVLAGIAFVGLFYMVAKSVEDSVRGKGIARSAEAPAAESGSIVQDAADAVKAAIGKIEDATNQAIAAVTDAGGSAVNAVTGD